MKNRVSQMGGTFKSGSGSNDSLKHRNKNEDSITISFRYLDSTRNYKLDSSISDFTRRFIIPATHVFLGNTGNASRSILFSPVLQAGFDPGFHAFDIYKWQLDRVRFFQTTRPYSEINYFLGTRVEQIIELLHTQNIKPNWNFGFQYRLVNSPGFFKSQKTNHNNYLLNSRYQSKNQRYTNYFVLLGNKLVSAENGGIVDTSATPALDNPDYSDRFNIPTYIGKDQAFSANFFGGSISTGNTYSFFTAMLRQQYDIGKKDSLVTDSTVIPLFFPRLRFEHTLLLEKQKYFFHDDNADSLYYKKYYDTTLRYPTDTLLLQEKWQTITNDFSIYQFPDAKNLHQFIKLGAMFQLIRGDLPQGRKTFFNTSGHAEYRNKSKNQRWDIEANAKLFFTGFNAGDYDAHISIESFAGKKAGYIKLAFENTSRTPSFLFDNRSGFYLLKSAVNFKKENTTHLSASYFLPSVRFRISGHYYLATNYTYLQNYYQLKQEASLFNVFQLALQKTIKLGKRWNWHTDIYFQQALGSAPVNLPALYTRNRIAYEGNLGFKNLDIAMGVEMRYRVAYKADGYSPALGRFFYQSQTTIRNKMPDITTYVHFRIKLIKFFIRAENLNTARVNEGFGFTNNNFLAPGYALPGLQIRTGVYWSFVN
jgi:Putative porin